MNRRTLLPVLLLLSFFIVATTPASAQDIKAGKYDNGLMWTFDFPPTDHIAETYGFRPDQEWFARARLGALRLPNCSASFVSASGLVMTNHHCGRNSVAAVTREGENLLEEGFFAVDLADERLVDGLYVDQLVAIEDVTDQVYAALDGMQTDAERANARQEAIEDITREVLDKAGGAGSGHVVEVINLYQGGKYSAYTFRRYSDLRLVMAPELQLGYFGGDTDNFTYPRYALDVTFFRVYENGDPFESVNHFRWSSAGANEGDPVFVIGNPGSTNRLETVEQLRWRGEISERAILEFVQSRIDALEMLYEAEPSDDLRNEIFGLKNTEKLYIGRVKGLNDSHLLARRQDSQNAFARDLEDRFAEAAGPDLARATPFLTLLDDIADVQDQKMEFANAFRSFFALQAGQSLSSAVVRRALVALNYLEANESGAANSSQLRDQLLSIEDHPEIIEERYLLSRLQSWVDNFGGSDPAVVVASGGKSIAEIVAEIMSGSALRSQDGLKQAVEDESLSRDDPALQFVSHFARRFADYTSGYTGLLAREAELNAQHGRAQFEIYGTTRPPDATFSLRIADGIVKAYAYNGTEAPPHTTFYGLYDRHFSNPGNSEFDLPSRWDTPPGSFEMGTPLNLVSTNDIIGGNSGSPLLNADLEIVGIAFDGNIESLPSAFIYNDDTGRTVSVDSRGILEALDEIYDMDRIVLELTRNELVQTEESADQILN